MAVADSVTMMAGSIKVADSAIIVASIIKAADSVIIVASIMMVVDSTMAVITLMAVAFVVQIIFRTIETTKEGHDVNVIVPKVNFVQIQVVEI